MTKPIGSGSGAIFESDDEFVLIEEPLAHTYDIALDKDPKAALLEQ